MSFATTVCRPCGSEKSVVTVAVMRDHAPVSSSALTVDEYRRTLALLRGQRITAVTYYLSTYEHDEIVVEEWDFGPWHQPTMGVELRTGTGAQFAAVWGSSFEHFGLEVFPEPMTNHLVRIGEPGGPAAVSVTDHPRWAGLVGTPIVSVDLAWLEDPQSTLRLPVSIRLRTWETTLWIAVGAPAAWPPADTYYLGTDDVMVVFTPEFATTVGIPNIA
jgi:hypothetical protein